MFDGGIRFNRNAAIDFIKAQYAAGKRYEWNVTEPDVHIRGNTAWIAYVNRGSITDTSRTAKQTWMESAFLQKQAGIWKIAFLHGTRVPEAPRQNLPSDIASVSAHVRLEYESINLETTPSQSSWREKVFESSLWTE
jgi:SnoaL-like protein